MADLLNFESDDLLRFLIGIDVENLAKHVHKEKAFWEK